MSADFQEITQFTPAYDKRDPDPKKNFGVHGVSLREYYNQIFRDKASGT